MEKKNNNKKVDTDVEKPKTFIMKFEFKDGVVFPIEVELIKDCFKGIDCFDPKEFKVEDGKLVVEGDFDWDMHFENISTNEEEPIKWWDLLRYKIHKIFSFTGTVEYGSEHPFGTQKWDKICRFRFLDMKLKFPYWLEYWGELVSQ